MVDPLLMVLCGITLVSLAGEIRDARLNLMSPFYANDAASDVLERRSAAQLRLLTDRGPDQGYFLEPYKSLIIPNNPVEEEAARQEFDWSGLNLNYVCGS